MTGLGKDRTPWLQPARAFASEFILSWLSATNASFFFFNVIDFVFLSQTFFMGELRE